MLPRPSKSPATPDEGLMKRDFLLVYDGDCSFCTWSLGLLQRTLPAVPRAVDGRRADVAALGLDEADVDLSAWLVELNAATSIHYGGVEGFAMLLRRQPSWPWRLAGNVMLLPGIREVGHLVYGWVARNRDRMPHGTAACAAH